MRKSALTKKEAAWLKELQRLLSKCPSTRLEFFTIGDPSVTVFDGSRMEDIDAEARSGGEFCNAVSDCGAELFTLVFPGNVHATAG